METDLGTNRSKQEKMETRHPTLKLKWKQEKLTLNSNKSSPLMETKMETEVETETRNFEKIDLLLLYNV